MEQLTTFVSSRGILKSCGCHNKFPTSSHPYIDPDLLDRHQSGGSIYVCTDALGIFASSLLPRIREPFVLVSGDSDIPISASFIANPAIRNILENEYLISWYAQNLSAQNPKLFHLPIGLDYHTMWEKPGFWGITAISPIAQENTLVNILAASPDFSQRYLAAYSNWHFALTRGDRQECAEKIDKSVCFFEANIVPRQSTWIRQSECMFVVSPEGAGLDCHRTWEAILLGCIPIVKRSALSDLFSDLPVLLISDWQEVNRDTMFQYITSLPERKYDFSSLFRDYWVRKITNADITIMDMMSYAEFRKLLTRKTG